MDIRNNNAKFSLFRYLKLTWSRIGEKERFSLYRILWFLRRSGNGILDRLNPLNFQSDGGSEKEEGAGVANSLIGFVSYDNANRKVWPIFKIEQGVEHERKHELAIVVNSESNFQVVENCARCNFSQGHRSRMARNLCFMGTYLSSRLFVNLVETARWRTLTPLGR